MATLGIFPAARWALADGYDIIGLPSSGTGCTPSGHGSDNCLPGCGPNPVYPHACVTNTGDAHYGFHKNNGCSWRLRPNQCYAGTYDGWKWKYDLACGTCSNSITYRCNDGYNCDSSCGGCVNSICRWQIGCS